MFFAEFLDQFTDLDDLFWVESYGWLIQNDDLGISEDCLGKSYSLFVSFGEVFDQAVGHCGDACQIHDLFDLDFSLVFRDFFEFRNEFQVFRDRHIEVQRGLFRQVSDAFFCGFRLF